MRAMAIGESALRFMPARRTLPALRPRRARLPRRPLFLRATQAVFGGGAPRARAVLMGEQRGSGEDLAGHPFVDPAGRAPDRALEAAVIVRSDTYVTNVVKHFKWEGPRERGAPRQAAAAPETRRARNRSVPALAGRAGVGPAAHRHLPRRDCGASAARRAFRVSVEHGRVRDTESFGRVMATIHPASILRQRTDTDRDRETSRFARDLQGAAALLKRLRTV